ncbi:AMP-dependent synthetase, partial [Cellulomonas bogoriensis 69B4 = DSM 16987]
TGGRPAGPVYTALVPTQLHRAVTAATHDPDLRATLARLDAVLVGGAATPRPLLERARGLGLRVVTTYGMTETCGGCVYDGVPLPGVRVDVRDHVVHLGGSVLARGYLGRPDLDDAAFTTLEGMRWLRTTDLGALTTARTDDGVRLTVHGRADDVVVTGGVKVPPGPVEDALDGAPGVGQVCVVGVPDAEWGQALTAVVVAAP